MQTDSSLPERTTGDLPSSRETRRPLPRSLRERYQNIRFVGEGGMGTVYRATDPRLGRDVALKLLKNDDPELWRRFLGEARSQARIQHEHVCRVYDAGEVDGEPFIAMQFIDGQPLSKVRERLSIEQRVHLMEEVALTVHEAHRIGIIHRDLKPGNILVEMREDGSAKPWVMDFGLARQVDEKGDTQTGAVVGTVAFMSPEQAHGNVHALDRRADVYSLGATLYDVIAGRPPFVADHPWKLLVMVGYEDPPSLGKVQKDVPTDLETIVMKCLEREVSRRYDSARALADELRRFLDGEPIVAKRASVGYVAWKKIKKNKLLAALLATAFCGAIGVVSVWMVAQRQAAAREKLAQELGESVKEMELFLRAAYELPLHDIERERDVVRKRLLVIEQRMREAGKNGEGPGHYALGRGHLALGDSALARQHLEQAIAAGYSSADLHYALGRALGELFRRAVEETRRITNQEERKQKVAALEKELRDPALVHLRSAVGARLESPLYAEGLIAFYEGKHEEAMTKAREAFAQAPWMYETKKLEADALFAEGSKYRHDAEFDFEKMTHYFAPAAKAYEVAEEMGRSDPDVYRSHCELWEKTAWALKDRGAKRDEELDRAEGACSRAIRASSRDGRALVQQAFVMWGRVFAFRGTPKEAAKLTDAAVLAAENALRARPEDIMAKYAHAGALYLSASNTFGQGRDVDLAPVIQAYERVINMDPSFTWAHNELGMVHLLAAKVNARQGKDSRPALNQAYAQFEHALSLDPAFSTAAFTALQTLTSIVGQNIERGQTGAQDAENLKKAIEAIEQRKKSDAWRTACWKARAHRILAERAFYEGEDPQPFIKLALDTIGEFDQRQSKDTFLLSEKSRCRLLEAAQAMRKGVDPGTFFDAARQAERDVTTLRGSTTIAARVQQARIELLAWRASARFPSVAEPSFDAIASLLRADFEARSEEPAIYAILAEAHARQAERAVRLDKDPQNDIVAGLARVDDALARNPQSADSFINRGQLHLIRARHQHPRNPQASREAAQRAKSAFDEAFRLNRYLARDLASEIDELSRYLP